MPNPSSGSRISAHRQQGRGREKPTKVSANQYRIRVVLVVKLTVFSMLSALKVCDAVTVFVAEGVGKKAVAIL
jgi:hypothetical protein